MIGYKIDCIHRTIDAIVINNHKDIMREIGNNCNAFICPYILSNGDVIFADYYGFFKNNNNAIMHNEYEMPIYGNIVIVGINELGEIANVLTEYTSLNDNISFLNIKLARRLSNNKPYNESTTFSKN